MDSEIFNKIKNLATSISNRESCILYDIELVGRGNGSILRVFIDKEHGIVDVDDCSRISKALNLILDVEDLIQNSYNLEVSSPGVERVLKQPWHFKNALDCKVKVKLKRKLEELMQVQPKIGRMKEFKCKIIEVSDEFIVVTVIDRENEQQLKLPFEYIEKAKIIYDFTAKQQQKPKHE